ncbi:alpha/beta hydrolase-fold protein [Cohnella ginsengisoli]|uniref:Alpha/beta hydrolase-fold protein n=1 Tax=Cohnella ginsengisoli TaxID=425004 RepID=A0A9X4KI93_9BACL|nr:alpha/beta hydrolase-fold protein [Cohnella ginsengisoli]MDG0792316.1 alpha/beta hydrolase-fold protein [Cohnella ginsengisoli]
MPVSNHRFHANMSDNTVVNYQLFLPRDYASTEANYPLILFLHGINRRGSDIQRLDGYGLAWVAENKQDFPFIVVTPQCPADSDWTKEYDSILALVSDIQENHRVDEDRLYVAGFSMGGHGTWDYASRSPQLFVAFVPMSGWFDPSKAMLLTEVPIWAFHCVDDDKVPVSETKDMVQALTAIGAHVNVTYFAGLRHDAYKVIFETFSNAVLFEWLLKQKKTVQSGECRCD